MISSKWLELYQYITSHIDNLPAEKRIEEQLNDKLMFLSAQFLDKKKQDKNQIDWLEHEAFTLVLSDVFQKTSFTSSTLSFLFETLMAAQLCQLAMSMINHHKKVLPEEDFKTKCGLVYQQLGDYELAKTIFEEVLTLNNTNPMTHCHLGFTHLYLSNMELAIDCFEQSIEIAPNFVGGYQNLSGLYYQEGNFLKAAAYAEQAHSLDKKLVSTYITAISSYLALGEKNKAEQWINAAFDNHVVSMELVRLAGISAHQNGRCEEAIEALDHYLSVNPSCFDVLNIRAHAKADIKDYAKLEPDLKQLLIFEPHDEWSLEQLFLCYFHTEQWSEAQIIMVELNKLSAHFKITHRALLNTINKKLSLDILELS